MRIRWDVIRGNCFLLLTIFVVGMSCGAAPEPDKTVYSNTSNKELKQKALGLVKNIRVVVDSYNKKDRALMDEYDKKNKPEIRIDERKAMRTQWLKESDALHDSSMRAYRDNYWSDAILLRNEIYKRLPKELRQKNLEPLYQNPTNVLGIQIIADNLELIAKSLPDS
jgi:uncharacterized NAD(P)/FAD-binding protein YdhS